MLAFRLLAPWVLLLAVGLRAPAETYVVAQRDAAASDLAPGTAARPWKTLARATRALAPGDVVLVRDGLYREQVVITNDGTAEKPIRLEAAPGAAEVILTGADRLMHWSKPVGALPVYQASWPYRFIGWSPHMTHPDDEYHRLIGRCEQVAIDRYLLRQVLEASQLAPGTFWVDASNGVLRVWDSANRDLNKVFVEASARSELLRVSGRYVEVRGMGFRFAANMAQHGAVVLAGDHDVLEDCWIAQMNSSGATFAAPHQTVRRCAFRDNGQLGFGANGAHELLFTDCVVENNNSKGFDRGWEAGGDKLVLSRDAVLERSCFLRNRGNGIWFDIGNEHCTVRQCLIADNEDSGIFCEISYGLQALDNVIVGNGFAPTAGAWGAQAGIALSSSPECLVERNLMVGNREGFNFREQTRTTPRIGGGREEPVWNHDEQIRNNIIALNRDAQIWGWFDVRDGRQWPAGSSNSKSAEGQPVSTAAFTAGPWSLEKLHLVFQDNVYFATAGQGWFEWGVTWSQHRSYRSLPEFQSALHIDIGGKVVDPAFSSLLARDFRLSAQTLRRLEHSYPRGPVPGTLLGPRP